MIFSKILTHKDVSLGHFVFGNVHGYCLITLITLITSKNYNISEPTVCTQFFPYSATVTSGITILVGFATYFTLKRMLQDE